MHRTSVLKESAPPQPSHERHRPEKTLLYRIIARYYPEFRSYMALYTYIAPVMSTSLVSEKKAPHQSPFFAPAKTAYTTSCR